MCLLPFGSVLSVHEAGSTHGRTHQRKYDGRVVAAPKKEIWGFGLLNPNVKPKLQGFGIGLSGVGAEALSWKPWLR